MDAVLTPISGVRVPRWARFLIGILMLGTLAACGGSVSPTIGYKLPALPFELVYKPPSHFSIEGDNSFVTPIGEFSIGADYDLPENSSSSIYVILRDRATGYDQIFQVKTGGEQFSAVLNGTTVVTVMNNQVIIDVTKGNIKKITFKRAGTSIPEQASSNWFAQTWHGTNSRWDQGWQQSWYKPFALSKWAYDDSTIEKWYGAGFVLFLLRFVLAIVLGIVDLILTLGFVVGQLAFLVFGPTGRDVVYGFMILGVIVLVVAGIANG